MRARATMNDVARLAGVSLKTVSRVINGERGVSAGLTAQVRTAVAELRYRPDLQASTLRRADRRTGTIGLLLADVSNPFSAALHRAVEDVARSHGTHVLIGSIDECPRRAGELARAFTMRRVDGLIIVPVGSDLVRDVGGDTPVVFVDRPAVGMRADTVLATNAFGAAEGTRHLIAHGHRRIAYVGEHRLRRDGCLAAQRVAGIGLDRSLVAASADDVFRLFALADPPTAVFTGQCSVTVEVVRALRQMGLHRRVALVGFDDFPLADLLEPGVSVVAQDPAAMGRTAAEVLFRRIEGDDGRPASYWIPTRLVRRGSGELPPA